MSNPRGGPKPGRVIAYGLIGVALFLGAAGFYVHETRPAPAQLAPVAAATAPATTAAPVQTVVANPCPGSSSIQLQATMPTFFLTSGQQIGADCFAWQEFIYLNWAADPAHPGQPDPNAAAASFGTAGDTAATVWESYQEAAALFAAPGTAAARAGAPGLKPLFHLSELEDIQLKSIGQAGNGKWLTTQGGGLTYYEVRLNLDEAAFIKTNVFSGSDLTTFAGQLACASQAGTAGVGGFNLPQGGGADTDCTGAPATYGLNMGAIELKASWIVLPPDHSLDYRYLTAVAQIVDPYGKRSTATVGLVGLHIIHKVQGGAQLLWATFEQIDNDPDENGGKPQPPALPPNPNQKTPAPGYTYYNPNCAPASDPYKCVPNQLPGTACATPPPNPTPAGCDPYSAPMQVTRIYAVDPTANSATGYAWSLMPAASVFNYYRLIEVQWPNSSTVIAPQSRTPLTPGDITPADATLITANTTAETYVQNTRSCMDCHQNAPIAQRKAVSLANVNGHAERHIVLETTGTAPYASDYSFLFTSETTH